MLRRNERYLERHQWGFSQHTDVYEHTFHFESQHASQRRQRMSGGTFDYKQYQIGYIADQIEEYIVKNDNHEVDAFGNRKYSQFTPETIAEFRSAVTYLRIAETYAQRVDWLLACDDSEESFHARLKKDLGVE
jgi:hypothetical protein